MVAGAALALMGVAHAIAHQPAPTSPPPAAAPKAEAQAGPGTHPVPAEPAVSRPGATGLLELKPESLPPQLLLGRRVEEIRRACEVIPVVVVVDDSASYIEAISRWTPARRFPVLFNDGSFETREDIARFVRGFRPTSVVQWAALKSGDRASTPSAALLTRAVARAWGWAEVRDPSKQDHPPQPQEFLADLWRRQHPPGVVVTSATDPAWSAALAIAAFRGEPLVFPSLDKSPGSLGAIYSAAEADALASGIDQGCEALAAASGLGWHALGDDLDAITVCLNCPVKAWVNATDVVALTDRLGRSGPTENLGPRWAWAGQVFGSESQASYRAMCSLFLSPTSAWLFDGYANTKGFADYDCTPAAEALRGVGMAVQLDDAPNQGEKDWRAKAAKPLVADLAFVTTMGNADFFDLNPGTCRPGDVPILMGPTAVHFTHSWSAQWPGSRDTIAGRWFEHGAYAYVGSVQEPYLQAFVPTKALVMRLASGGPWGIFARMDGGPFSKPWKVAVFGDPLAVLGDPLKRSGDSIPLAGTTDLGEAARSALREGRFPEAIADFLMIGRDDAVHRLAMAMRAERSAALSPEVIAAAILPAFRRGQSQDLADLYALLPEDQAKNPALRDALWLSAPALLNGQIGKGILETYRANLRDDQIERDATELARAWSLHSNRADALGMLQELRPRYTDPSQKQGLEKAIAAYRHR